MFEGVDLDYYWGLASQIIAAAAIIAAATKNPRDDEYVSTARKWFKRARSVVDVLGFNFGGARNDPDGAPNLDKIRRKGGN